MYELVFTIDHNVRRRAAISYFVNSQGIFAEPFETIEEFVQSWPKSGIILVHDDNKAVAALVQEIIAATLGCQS